MKKINGIAHNARTMSRQLKSWKLPNYHMFWLSLWSVSSMENLVMQAMDIQVIQVVEENSIHTSTSLLMAWISNLSFFSKARQMVRHIFMTCSAYQITSEVLAVGIILLMQRTGEKTSGTITMIALVPVRPTRTSCPQQPTISSIADVEQLT